MIKESYYSNETRMRQVAKAYDMWLAALLVLISQQQASFCRIRRDISSSAGRRECTLV